MTALQAAFDLEHERLFSFVLENEHELVTVRATVSGPRPELSAPVRAQGPVDPSAALRLHSPIWVEGAHVEAAVYDRDRLQAGNVIDGPAIVTEMDSTTLVLPGHTATVHRSGALLIRPVPPTGQHGQHGENPQSSRNTQSSQNIQSSQHAEHPENTEH